MLERDSEMGLRPHQAGSFQEPVHTLQEEPFDWQEYFNAVPRSVQQTPLRGAALYTMNEPTTDAWENERMK